jgi:hypothetical protein
MIDRQTSQQIELIKWLAIIGIFLFHFMDTIQRIAVVDIPGFISSLFHVGSQGIHLFFIFSAFLLYLKYGREPTKFSVITRIKKLYPQYVLGFIIVVIVFGINGVFFRWDELLLNIAPVVRNFSYDYVRSINGNWWFVHTLIEFYLAVKIIFFIVRKVGPFNFLWMSYVISVSYISIYTFGYEVDTRQLNPFSTFFLNYLYDFGIGIFLAHVYLKRSTYSFNVYVLLLVGLTFEGIGYVITVNFGQFGLNINDIFFSIGLLSTLYALILLIERACKEVYNQLDFLIINSGLIYLIYLIHHPIIKVVTDIYSIKGYIDVVIVLIISLFGTISLSILGMKVVGFIGNSNVSK